MNLNSIYRLAFNFNKLASDTNDDNLVNTLATDVVAILKKYGINKFKEVSVRNIIFGNMSVYLKKLNNNPQLQTVFREKLSSLFNREFEIEVQSLIETRDLKFQDKASGSKELVERYINAGKKPWPVDGLPLTVTIEGESYTKSMGESKPNLVAHYRANVAFNAKHMYVFLENGKYSYEIDHVDKVNPTNPASVAVTGPIAAAFHWGVDLDSPRSFESQLATVGKAISTAFQRIYYISNL